MLRFKRDKAIVPSIEERFQDRQITCSYIRMVGRDLADELEARFGIDLTVTSSRRTTEENERVGGKANSLHLAWRSQKQKKWIKSAAIDIRTWTLTEDIIKYAQEYIKRKWFTPLQAKLIWEPSARSGGHLHLQTMRFENWTGESS